MTATELPDREEVDDTIKLVNDHAQRIFLWRYERERPGELLHLDVKKLARIAGRVGHRIHGDRSKSIDGAGWEFVHVCIDDNSRLAYAEILPDEQGPTATSFLRRALAFYRQHGIRVERVLTDNGACYRSHVFRALCLGRSIRVLKTRPYRPQTNGKAERLIQTLLRDWAYARPLHPLALPSSSPETVASLLQSQPSTWKS